MTLRAHDVMRGGQLEMGMDSWKCDGGIKSGKTNNGEDLHIDRSIPMSETPAPELSAHSNSEDFRTAEELHNGVFAELSDHG